MDLDRNAATSPRHPTERIELAAELRYQNPDVRHRLALQIGLGRQSHRRRTLHPVDPYSP